MEYPLLDTSVFSTYKKQIDANFDSFHFSVVVFYELMASMIDESTMKKYEYWLKVLDKADKLRLEAVVRKAREMPKSARRGVSPCSRMFAGFKSR